MRGLLGPSHDAKINKRRESQRRWESKNRKSRRAKSRKWAAKHREQAKQNGARWRRENSDRCRDRKLRSLYGITLAEYNNRLASQDGKCAICKGSTTLCVDHDHKTGKVRALLCDRCNRGIGYLREDPKIVAAAVSYLRLHGEV